jgi:hypothetical protein
VALILLTGVPSGAVQFGLTLGGANLRYDNSTIASQLEFERQVGLTQRMQCRAAHAMQARTAMQCARNVRTHKQARKYTHARTFDSTGRSVVEAAY